MKKLLLIKDYWNFQEEKYLNKNKSYFEGWYFKNTNGENKISFIPGISINEYEKKAFIQIITGNESYFVNYDICDFNASSEPFYIKIGNSLFSKDGIYIDIKDDKQKLVICGNIRYSNGKNINVSKFSPNIMGPFSYIQFMECNHAVLNMRTVTHGFIDINKNKLIFDEGFGYIEKDW